MADHVSVSVGARLHMGFLDLNFGLGRRFGSIGMAIDAPRTRITLRRAAAAEVAGHDRVRAAQYLAAVTQHLGIDDAHSLLIEEAIPPHSGLGSGTKLALAIAASVRRLHGLPGDVRADAQVLGRGARSGVGLALFHAGGFVVDGGHGAGTELPPVLTRLSVPSDWRVLLILDHARSGLSGRAEKRAFATLPPQDEQDAAHICRLVLMQLLPALAERDLPRFGQAITHIQEICGDYFAPEQGGRFTSSPVAAALEELRNCGAVALGQSSWGPTGFAFVPDDDTARRVAGRAREAADGTAETPVDAGPAGVSVGGT